MAHPLQVYFDPEFINLESLPPEGLAAIEAAFAKRPFVCPACQHKDCPAENAGEFVVHFCPACGWRQSVDNNKTRQDAL